MDKDFIPYLYSENSVSDMIKAYAVPLLTSQDLIKRHKAKRLLEYRSTITDLEFISRLNDLFENLYQKIRETYPNISFELIGRIKSLFSVVNKLDELEEKARKSKKSWEKENPFARVHDFFAFRIILEDLYADELINELYGVANLIIDLFLSLGFEIIEHDSLLETGALIVESPNIYIPEKSLLKPEYLHFVKDYVTCPKKEGYQSLHIVVSDPITQRLFEVQVRTRSMDIIADTLAAHSQYKYRKYKKQQAEQETVDYSKIHVRGFRFLKYIDNSGQEKTITSDTAGLKYAIPISMANHN